MRSDKLKAIHQQQIQYVQDSGISVEVVEIYGQVTMTKEDESTFCYLEGFEAELLYTVPRDLQGSWVSLTSNKRC